MVGKIKCLFLVLCFCPLFAVSKNTRPPQVMTLSWAQFQTLSDKDKNHYMKSMARLLFYLNDSILRSESSSSDPWSSMATLENWFWQVLVPKASANRYDVDALGGGVPVRGGSQPECGVRSYAGYTCPAGQRICNPMLFGVRAGTHTPVCFPCARIQTCFNEIIVGVHTELTPVFQQPGARQTYVGLARIVNRNCVTQDRQFPEGPLGEECRLWYNQYFTNFSKRINCERTNFYADTFLQDPGVEVTYNNDLCEDGETPVIAEASAGDNAIVEGAGPEEVQPEGAGAGTDTDPDPAIAAVEVPQVERPAAPPTPTGPPPLSQVRFQQCFQGLAELRRAVGSANVERMLGQWSLVSGSASRRTLREFTVGISNGSLVLEAMGFTFRDATVCMSQPEGYFRLRVRSMLVNEEVDIRLPQANTLISYKDDGSELVYRRHSVSGALQRETAGADTGVL